MKTYLIITTLYQLGQRHMVPLDLKDSKLLKKIGRKVHEATGEKRSMSYLIQNISMAIQRANAVCVMGTAPTTMGLEGLFDFVSHES